MQLKAVCKELPSPVHGRSVQLIDTLTGISITYIQSGVTLCCGMNALIGFNLSMLNTQQRVKEFFDDLALMPWRRSDCVGLYPYYDMKHYIFTCGMGPSGGKYVREEGYKHLIADPRVKLINRSRSISEPGEGHDIGIFFVDLTK